MCVCVCICFRYKEVQGINNHELGAYTSVLTLVLIHLQGQAIFKIFGRLPSWCYLTVPHLSAGHGPGTHGCHPQGHLPLPQAGKGLNLT